MICISNLHFILYFVHTRDHRNVRNNLKPIPESVRKMIYLKERENGVHAILSLLSINHSTLKAVETTVFFNSNLLFVFYKVQNRFIIYSKSSNNMEKI